MSNPLIRSVEHFVLLEPDSKEKIVTKKEAILWIKGWLPKVQSPIIYQSIDYSKDEFFIEFLENTCELEIKSGYIIKWFAIRIDPD